MEIALLFGGVLVSLIVEVTKKKLNLNAGGVMVLVAILSLVGGFAYKAMLAYGLWEAFISVLVASGAFYAFIIKNVKDISPSGTDRETI